MATAAHWPFDDSAVKVVQMRQVHLEVQFEKGIRLKQEVTRSEHLNLFTRLLTNLRQATYLVDYHYGAVETQDMHGWSRGDS